MIFTHMLIVLTMVSSGDSGRLIMLIANVHIIDIYKSVFSLSMSEKWEKERVICVRDREPEKDVKTNRKRKIDAQASHTNNQTDKHIHIYSNIDLTNHFNNPKSLRWVHGTVNRI